MSVQRYVFRYAPDKPLEGYIEFWRRRTRDPVEQDIAAWAKRDSERDERLYADRPYEKEGGGLTTELTEAKVVGWRSTKKWMESDGHHGDLLPVTISLAPVEAFGRDATRLDGEATKAGNSSKPNHIGETNDR